MFLYSSVKASDVMTEVKSMDCYSSKQSTQKSNFMFLLFVYEGDYETCYVIACLYKVDYTNKKELINPSCSEQACAWNQGTKKEVVTKRIADLLVRKRFSLFRK